MYREALTRKHEDLDGIDNQNVVDVETGVAVVEREEAVDGELRAEVVVLATEHLLAHTRADLRREVQNSAEAEVTTLATLVVLRVLDASATSEGVHARVDILVQVKTLLRLGDTAARRHEERVEEIRVTVVQLAANPRKRARREGTERLFLSSREVTEDTNVLREDVLARADDGDRGALEVLVAPLRVRALARDRVLLELREHVPDLETFLEVVVLVRVDELEIFAAVEDDRMVLVIRLAVAKDRVTGELDAELGAPTASLGNELGVAVDKRREQARVTALLARGLFLEVRNLEVGVRAQEELGVLLFLAVELRVACPCCRRRAGRPRGSRRGKEA